MSGQTIRNRQGGEANSEVQHTNTEIQSVTQPAGVRGNRIAVGQEICYTDCTTKSPKDGHEPQKDAQGGVNCAVWMFQEGQADIHCLQKETSWFQTVWRHDPI